MENFKELFKTLSQNDIKGWFQVLKVHMKRCVASVGNRLRVKKRADYIITNKEDFLKLISLHNSHTSQFSKIH